jgi:hypothetical protein
MTNEVRRCVLCHSDDIAARYLRGRIVTVTCRGCGGVVRVEFDPPDEPGLRGRIEVLVDPITPPPGITH